MSTSINDLPQSSNPSNDEDVNENMMVNSILQEIENDEDINNENEDSLNYIMDSSQVPPKIGNQVPTPEMIQTATEDMFKNNPVEQLPPPVMPEIPDIPMEPVETKLSDDSVLPKLKVKTDDLVGNVDNMMTNIINKAKAPVIIFVLFMFLSLPQLNRLLIKILPKLSTNGTINMLGNVLKGFVLATFYFIISFFV